MADVAVPAHVLLRLEVKTKSHDLSGKESSGRSLKALKLINPISQREGTRRYFKSIKGEYLSTVVVSPLVKSSSSKYIEVTCVILVAKNLSRNTFRHVRIVTCTDTHLALTYLIT